MNTDSGLYRDDPVIQRNERVADFCAHALEAVALGVAVAFLAVLIRLAGCILAWALP